MCVYIHLLIRCGPENRYGYQLDFMKQQMGLASCDQINKALPLCFLGLVENIMSEIIRSYKVIVICAAPVY